MDISSLLGIYRNQGHRSWHFEEIRSQTLIELKCPGTSKKILYVGSLFVHLDLVDRGCLATWLRLVTRVLCITKEKLGTAQTSNPRVTVAKHKVKLIYAEKKKQGLDGNTCAMFKVSDVIETVKSPSMIPYIHTAIRRLIFPEYSSPVHHGASDVSASGTA